MLVWRLLLTTALVHHHLSEVRLKPRLNVAYVLEVLVMSSR
jgi:hypothetical protein